MESLSETVWDVVICGTGLQQSLLALALSRSDKKVLHIDPNQYYGGSEAAFSLEEAEEWARAQAAPSGDSVASKVFTSASVTRPPQDDAGNDSDGARLSSSRAYALALAPQLIHARSRLVSQLVSSRAFRQLEFLAVGSFFVLGRPPSPDAESQLSPQLAMTRIPSTREDVFSDDSIPARAKRSLMKFLRFVLDYDAPPQADLWQANPDQPLAEFLEQRFKLDAGLRAYVLVLTLAPDFNQVTTAAGLAAIHRHLTSMGVFGPGFAALYPKWGGASEVAQVACRAGAVGGGVYMLGTGLKNFRDGDGGLLEVELSTGISVRAKLLVRGREEVQTAGDGVTRLTPGLSRIVAVIGSPLPALFESVVEGAPAPAAAVIACPPGALDATETGQHRHPVYMLAHSSETGECPPRQTVLYLSTSRTPNARDLLKRSLESLLAAVSGAGNSSPQCLYQLYYEQAVSGAPEAQLLDGRVFTFPSPSAALAFDDETLLPVQEAWKAVVGAAPADEVEYMKFSDREGVGDDDDDYE